MICYPVAKKEGARGGERCHFINYFDLNNLHRDFLFIVILFSATKEVMEEYRIREN